MLTIDFLGSGSGGNATLVRWDETALLLDCGFGPRVLRDRLALVGLGLDDVDALLLTHEHGDHVAGLSALARQEELTIHLTPATARGIGREAVSRWSAARDLVKPGRPFHVGPVEVVPFTTVHDARGPVGYVLRMPDGRRLGFATDMGHVNAEALDALRGCDLLAIEANHDPDMLRWGPYPGFLKRRIRSDRGHLSNAEAASLLARTASDRLEQVFVMHISRTNNQAGLARQALESRLSRLGLRRPAVTVVEQDRVLRYPLPGQLSLF